MVEGARMTYKQMLLVLVNIVSTLREKNIFLPRERTDFRLKSNAFRNGGKIKKKYTPYGADVNPDLYWYGIPKHTKSFALIVDDLDAPNPPFCHWVVKNLPLVLSLLVGNIDMCFIYML